MRSVPQKLWDKTAVMALFDAVNRVGTVDGNLKAQKLLFLYELKGQEQGQAVGHYRFFRYQLGPYSADLANDVSELEDLGMVSRGSRQLLPRGRFVLDYARDSLGQIGALISEIARSYGRASGAMLRDRIYEMRVPVFDLGRKERVRDVPSFLDIIDPIHTPSLQDIQLPEDIANDLAEEFSVPADHLKPSHPSFQAAVQRALSSIPA